LRSSSVKAQLLLVCQPTEINTVTTADNRGDSEFLDNFKGGRGKTANGIKQYTVGVFMPQR
jgi:hypothetical protein